MRLRHAALGVFALMLPSFAAAGSGTLYLSPEHGAYTIGDVFEVDVLADTGGSEVNAAEADLSYNAAALEVQSVASDGSVLSLWPTPPKYSNDVGTISFSGTASKTFSGKNALLARIIFKAKSVQAGDVRFDSGALLAADNHATNIITSMRSGLYTLSAGQTNPAPAAADSAADVTTSATSSEPDPQVKGASIEVPMITAYDARITVGERIVLAGTASPDSTFTMYLQHGDETPVQSTIATTRDGTFAYIADEPARSGTYQAWAATGSDNSLVSDKVTILASRLSAVAAIEAAGAPLTIGLPAFMAVLVAGLLYALIARRR